jgi:hypothetical protein
LPTNPTIQRFAVRHVGATGGKICRSREALCEETASCRFRRGDCACRGSRHGDQNTGIHQSTDIRGPAFPVVRLSCRPWRGRCEFTQQSEHPCDPTRTNPNFVPTTGAAIPRANPLASSEFATIRERLIKIGARVIEHIARIRVQLPTSCTEGASFQTVTLGLMRSGP